MASLLFVIFAVELAVAVVNSIGAATINDLLWKLYVATPLGTSKQIRDQRELQQSYMKVRRDLNATSSQDEFAKWAKLRRQHDKMLEELEKMKTGIDGSKAAFDKTVTTARWLGTSGLRYFLPFWYAKSPMFWLPHGWFPYYAEWIISFPRAPMGSVSVASWQLACTGVITIVVDAITALVGLVVAGKQGAQQGKNMEEPVKASASPAGDARSQGEDSKKEL
ncbi:GET complex subunit get1 [Diaporthe australafricana]|uniref:GET complex subunit get1 n=1 Tax=Diaporthe australafricana TaxID=127596 RepID=A0ABR3VX19_9PEZI